VRGDILHTPSLVHVMTLVGVLTVREVLMWVSRPLYEGVGVRPVLSESSAVAYNPAA